MTRNHLIRECLALVSLLALAIPSPAQIGPEDNIRKILKSIAGEMNEIDRLLMESSRKDASSGMGSAADKIKELMQKSLTGQDQVVEEIGKLIDELQKLQANSSQSSSGQPSQDQQSRPGQKPSDQPRSTREETPSPERIRRPENKNQAKPNSEPQPSQAKPDPLSRGRNLNARKRPEDGTEQAQRAANSARWGNLPKYVRFMMNRGGLPDVPEKYRRLLEAYQKQTQKRRSK